MMDISTRIAVVYFGIGALVTIFKCVYWAVTGIKYNIVLAKGGKIVYALTILFDLLLWPADLVATIKYKRMSSEERHELKDTAEELLGDLYQ